MKKVIVGVEEIKEQINALKGKQVEMLVNRGRKRIQKYNVVIENAYPSIFTVKVKPPTIMDKLSYSYSDVLCGDVKIIKEIK